MKPNVLLAVISCLFFSSLLLRANTPQAVHVHASAGLQFIENKGQWHENVQYKVLFGGVNAVFLEQGLLTYVYHDPQTAE